MAGFVHRVVGRLNEAAQQRRVGFTSRGAAEEIEGGFHRGAGGEFSEVLPADSVGDYK
jgi:hypothetical protein